MTFSSLLKQQFQTALIDAYFRYYIFTPMLVCKIPWTECQLLYAQQMRKLHGIHNTISNELVNRAIPSDHL